MIFFADFFCPTDYPLHSDHVVALFFVEQLHLIIFTPTCSHSFPETSGLFITVVHIWCWKDMLSCLAFSVQTCLTNLKRAFPSERIPWWTPQGMLSKVCFNAIVLQIPGLRPWKGYTPNAHLRRGNRSAIGLLGGGFKAFLFYFHPYLGKMNPFWRFAHFSKGLGNQPPTRLVFLGEPWLLGWFYIRGRGFLGSNLPELNVGSVFGRYVWV